MMEMMSELASIAKETKAWACYDCGKCTSACPLTRVGRSYSPRRHVLATVLGNGQEILDDGTLYTCLSCGLCDDRCPPRVHYTTLVRRLREMAWADGQEPECPHGGAMQSVMRMMARGKTTQNRMAWLDDTLQTDPKKGEVFFWTGCTMYYDAFFPEFGLASLNATRESVRLLNRLGVVPVVSPEERCCGHDLAWNGDRSSFEALAKHNMALVAESGAETVVTPCAECYRTWSIDYASLFNGRRPRVLHLSEFLADRLSQLPLQPIKERRVTFQDPCRLGRHMGVYEAPRKVLEAIPGVTVVEMPRHGARAVCCAGGTWSNCDRFAKQIQTDRLREARATGANTMVTACPKCQIHFRCAMVDPNIHEEIEIEMCDISQLVGEALA